MEKFLNSFGLEFIEVISIFFEFPVELHFLHFRLLNFFREIFYTVVLSFDLSFHVPLFFGLSTVLFEFSFKIFYFIDEAILLDLASLIFLFEQLFSFFLKQGYLLMILIFHGGDDLSLKGNLFFADSFQKLFFFENVAIDLTDLIFHFFFSLIIVHLMLLDEFILVESFFFHQMLDVFVQRLITYVFLKNFSLGYPCDFLSQFVVFSADGVEQIMFFYEYLLIFFAVFEETVVFGLQLSKDVVFVD
jgi:hypothetical protein